MNTKKNKNLIKASLGTSRIEKYYGKIVLFFSVLTLVLILAILYFTFSKTTIIVYPQKQMREFSFSTTITEVGGMILVTEVEGSKTSNKINSVVKKPAKAQGEVSLVNRTASAQPLVATTRLLSKEGILFRIAETVAVPPRGEIKARVIADQEGEVGNIGPTTFEIVALWEGLKKDIYATSSEAMTGGVIEVGALANDDIKNVQKDLERVLIDQAYELFKLELKNRLELPENALLVGEDEEDKTPYVIVEKINMETSANEGEEVDSVEVTEKISVSALVVGREKIVAFVENNVTKEAKVGETLVTYSSNQIQLKDINKERADGNLLVTGKIEYILSEQSPILEVKNFTSKTESEIKKYFSGFKEINSVKVQFSPFWLKRTPEMPDNVIIKVITL